MSPTSSEEAVPVFASPSPQIRQVPLDRPWQWLAAGWRDVLAMPMVSVACGLVVFATSVVLTGALFYAQMPWLVLPLSAGFMFMGPLMALGLYEASRLRAQGEAPSLGVLASAWRRNPEQVAYMALLLALFVLAWVRVATLIYALFFSQASPSLDRVVDTLLFSPSSLPFLFTGTIVGFGFACLAFAMSAVALPMLLDRQVNVFTAIATSVTAVRRNWQTMGLWAGLIVVFTAIGVATLYIGLIITLPLIGHATWHAYRDLVE